MTKFPPIAGIYPDVHEKKIKEYFAGVSPGVDSAPCLADVMEDLECLYLICFTNRCGSNYVAQCLASDGQLLQAGENLNFNTVITQSQKRDFKTFDSYLAWLIASRKGPRKVFGCKASVGQLLMLYNAGLLHLAKDKIRFIHIIRDDVLEQAISLFIANRTQQWTSEQDAQAVEIDYEPAQLMHIMESISRQNSLFSLVLKMLGSPTLHVRYGDFSSDPLAGVQDVARHLGLSNLCLKSTNVRYAKQSNESNRELKRRWLADFSL